MKILKLVEIVGFVIKRGDVKNWTMMLAVMLSLGAQAMELTVAEKSGDAIQTAIDEVGAAGGGRVIVPAGEYPSSTIRLRSHVELHLEKGAVVKGGTNWTAYAQFPETVEPRLGRSLIQAWDVENISLTGEGVFECPGAAFFDATKRRFERFYLPLGNRPQMVLLHRCKNVHFHDVSFLGSPSWTMRLRLCENLDFKRIKVKNDLRFINADGIDFDGCRHVRLVDSDFLTGDDSIIMRAIPGRRTDGAKKIVTEDVDIENCRLESACQCVRIGCPSDDTIRNIRFRGLTMKGHNGICFDFPVVYLSLTDEGYVDIHDVTFEDVSGALDNCAVRIRCDPGVKIRGVRDVLFRNFDVKSENRLVFRGNVFSPVERIRRENFVLNGERLPDGEFEADCTSEKPLRRVQKGEYNYKEPLPYVPPKFVTVGERSGVAIQRAIDEVAANETGGCVIVPPGEYPSKLITLRSRVELRLRKGARLFGDGLRMTAADAESVALTGPGTVEVTDLRFSRCRGIRLDGVSFGAAPREALVLDACEDVEINGLGNAVTEIKQRDFQ